MECDTSNGVSTTMNCLSLQTPSKKSRRNKEDQQPVNTTQLCLVGCVRDVAGVVRASNSFGIPVVHSVDGLEHVNNQHTTVFILHDFEDAVYTALHQRDCRILGYPALLEIAARKQPIPDLDRPLYSFCMENIISCFTAFRDRDEINSLVSYIHHMGGSIRKDFDVAKITHLIANKVGGDKYHYAKTFQIPVMSGSWVNLAWEKRHELGLHATDPQFMTHSLKIFEGLKISFLGISDDEVVQMTEILTSNGGTLTTMDDPSCTHIVIDSLSEGTSIPESMPNKAFHIDVKWFWVSIQMDTCANEKLYAYKEKTHDFASPRNHLSPATPGSRTRKRKRVKDTVSQLAAQGGSPVLLQVPANDVNRRRSSMSESTMLSLSGSFLDATTPDKTINGTNDVTLSVPTPQDLKNMSPRHQVFTELLQTEMNYVDILETIVEVFKKPLEDLNQVGGPILDPTELKMIFGNLPPIHDIHFELLVQLKNSALNWREDISVGALILKHSQDLVKAYPPFVNFFEQTKEVLIASDRSKPRFHAFLKLGQSNPKCKRQTLQELLIRPVQRLPSISLLLNDLLKQTPKTNADHAELEKALAAIKEVMTHINEDKRRTEGQVVLFDIFNDIEHCPAHIVSSNRSFVSQCDVIELGDGIVGRGGQLTLFFFSDVIEICKRRSRGNTLRRDVSTISLQPNRGGLEKSNKPTYKHQELIFLSHVKRVVDITETEDCQNVFALIVRNHNEIKERLYSFEIISEDVEKVTLLKTLCRLMGNITCRSDAENYMTKMEAKHLDIDTSELASGTLRRAARLASKTRMAVNRAFSFNKTPSRLKRAMSTVMSPLRSSSHTNCDSSMVSPLVMSGGTMGMAASCANLATMEDSGMKSTPSSSTLKNYKPISLGSSAQKRL